MSRLKAAARILLGRKRSSSAMSSLAADYINLTPTEIAGLDLEDARIIASDVRRLAASVLSQDEESAGG